MTETPKTVTEDELTEALDSFWLFTDCNGQRVHGQVADPDEVASVLLATLGRIAAERSPDEAASPVVAGLDRATIAAKPSRAESPAPAPTDRSAAATDAAEAISIKIARALYGSIDRCARCKVCEHQIGPAAKIAVEAVRVERASAEAAEGKLAAIEEFLGRYEWTPWRARILAVIGGEEGARNG